MSSKRFNKKNRSQKRKNSPTTPIVRVPARVRTPTAPRAPHSPSLGDPNVISQFLDLITDNSEREFLQFLRGRNFFGLGMFQILQLLNNINFGQGPRDDFKLRAIKLFSMSTFTTDDKHDSVENIHVNANFNIPGNLIQAIERYFGPDFVIDIAELDYFFSPQGWAGYRWSADLLTTFCELARVGKLVRNGKIFIPHFGPIKEFLEAPAIREQILTYFNLELSIPGVNGGRLYSPLYYASSICERELLELSPPLYNANQQSHFINGKFGWYILTNKWIPTAEELAYDRQIISNQVRGYGPNGMQTRRGSGDAHLVGLVKPASR